MSWFTTTLQPVAAIRSAQLCTRIFATAERELQAYLIATHVEGRGPVIQIIHRPSICHAPLDSTNEDEQYGFIGDARHGQPPMLALWPERATGQTNSVNILSDTGTGTATALSGGPDLIILGPFPDAQAGVEAITVSTLHNNQPFTSLVTGVYFYDYYLFTTRPESGTRPYSGRGAHWMAERSDRREARIGRGGR
jgi:hypothetical protein